MKFNVAVVASRPAKDNNRRYLPVPSENVTFIHETLGKVAAEDYNFLMHGATANTVDDLVDAYAVHNKIPTKQFPAYWFNPKMENNRDKGAGYFATETMIRHLRDAKHNHPDTTSVVLAFYTTATWEQDPAVKHAVEFATKHFAAKDLEVAIRCLKLPVVDSNVPAANPATTTVPF